MKRIFTVALSILFSSFFSFSQQKKVDLVFMHDIHSYLDNSAKASTVIRSLKESAPNLLVLDGGDFSMGTSYQTIFETSACELLLLGALGVEATVLGNHEFDFGGPVLANMFDNAARSSNVIPKLLLCNVDWLQTDEYTTALKAALVDRYGCKPYVMINKGGVNIAVIGVFGQAAIFCSPTCKLTFKDPVQSVKECVALIKAQENPDMIVCISHSGTSSNPQESEDEILAASVPELDVILSAHSHTRLDKPLVIGNTVIVSAGAYNEFIGSVGFVSDSENRWKAESYSLINLNDSKIKNDPVIEGFLKELKAKIDKDYFSHFGYKGNQVLAQASSDISLKREVPYLMAQAMYKKAQDAGLPVDVAIVPSGCIRGTFDKGDITAARVFETFSLGRGEDGYAGYPLAAVWISGKDLKNACQLDSTIGLQSTTLQLFAHGLSYEYNPKRLPFDKVLKVFVVKDGQKIPVEDKKMYCMIIDYYSCNMLGNVINLTKGLVSIVPHHSDGTLVEDMSQAVIHNSDGSELKGWLAIAEYLEEIKVTGDYSACYEFQYVEKESSNLLSLVSHPSKVAWMIYALILFCLFLVALLVFAAVKIFSRFNKTN